MFIHETAIMKHIYPAGTQNGKLIHLFIQENISHWAIHYSFFMHIYVTSLTVYNTRLKCRKILVLKMKDF
jgi:hypothetical protein